MFFYISWVGIATGSSEVFGFDLPGESKGMQRLTATMDLRFRSRCVAERLATDGQINDQKEIFSFTPNFSNAFLNHSGVLLDKSSVPLDRFLIIF